MARQWLGNVGNAITGAARGLAELGVDDDEADFGLDLDAVRDEPMADQPANQPAGRPAAERVAAASTPALVYADG